MSKLTHLALVALALSTVGLAPVVAQAEARPDGAQRSCFFASQWRGWKSPSPRVLYLGVNVRDVYQVDLAADAPELNWVGARLVSIQRGSSICSAIDLDLKVSDDLGFTSPLFPTAIHKLTPEEVASIAPKDRP